MYDKQTLIDKMRIDWKVVAADKRRCGDWTEVDEKEIGDAVKGVVSGDDPEALLRWARWLAEMASAVLLLALVSNGINGNIRAAVAESKLKAKEAAL